MNRAAWRAMSIPQSRATTDSAMSIPADTPEDVTRVPSSTQRACRCHATRGPCCTTQSHATLLEVAGRPSISPVRASRAEPVQTVAVMAALRLAAVSASSSGALCTAWRVPARPGAVRDLRELPGGVGNTTHGEGVRRGIGYAIGFKNVGFARASSNLGHVNLLPAVGANVYDIMRHETLVLTRAAVEKLEDRFNG